jgi:flavin reductase (DIM6/NTAB) family NADH-FMN oxidoreductase RutF
MNKISIGPHTLLYPQPALLVATYDANNKPNFLTIAWSGICSSDPISVSVAIRPSRHSYSAIMTRKAFTINIPTVNMLTVVDYAGIVSGKNTDKFAASGLTPLPALKVDAPYIAQCPVVLECNLLRSLDLGAHTLMIAGIQDVRADKDCLNSATVPDLNKFAPLLFDSGSSSYYGFGNFLGVRGLGKALIKKG